MARTGKITLKQGNAKASGKPYTALALKIGKWDGLHFPSRFESGYLVEYLKNNDGKIELSSKPQSVNLIVGEYSHTLQIESSFEFKYIESYLKGTDEPAETVSSDVDDKLDLETEDELNTKGYFDN